MSLFSSFFSYLAFPFTLYFYRFHQTYRRIQGKISADVRDPPVPIHICHIGKAVRLRASLYRSSDRTFLYSPSRRCRSIHHCRQASRPRIPCRTCPMQPHRRNISMYLPKQAAALPSVAAILPSAAPPSVAAALPSAAPWQTGSVHSRRLRS